MNGPVLVVAPHPDDETLGCGGTLLRHQSEGQPVHWLIVSGLGEKYFTPERADEERAIIQEVKSAFRFTDVHELNLPTTELDRVGQSVLVESIMRICKKVQPEIMYLPNRNDAHSDHAAVFDAAVACTKWFRSPWVKKVMCYETLSETDFSPRVDASGMSPNVFVDIASFLEKKLEILKLYKSEIGEFPFPRSEKALRALAAIRGAASGFDAAEGFMLLRERN